MGLIAPAHELVDAKAGLDRLQSRKEELLTPSGPQGSQVNYLDSALAGIGQELMGNQSNYGIRPSPMQDDYLIGGSSQLQAALNMTTGLYMANEIPVMPLIPSRISQMGYIGCSSSPYDTC
jgi:hypothetical protein